MKNILFLFGFILIFSCSKDEEPIITPTPIDTKINFGDLKIGDEMAFLRFQSTCADFQGDFHLTGDTLIWTVTAMEGESGMFSEKFTDDSPLATDFPKVDVPVSSDPDYILIPDRWSSNLFFFYGNDTLWVNPASTVDLVQSECQLMVDNDGFRGDAIALLNQFKVEDYEFNDMTVVSCVPGGVSDAYIIYSDGKIKAIYSLDWFSGVPTGWIAME